MSHPWPALLSLAFALALLTGCPATGPAWVENPDCADIDRTPFETTDVTLTAPSITLDVRAEVAEGGRRAQGLMCRFMVPDGQGMLFPYDSPRTSGFWMFNTYVPLDILYIGEDGTVVAAREMAPCPRRGSEATPDWQARCSLEARGYQPDAPYTATLELPAGWLEEEGIAPGAAGLRVDW